jgi:hypothetical protein
MVNPASEIISESIAAGSIVTKICFTVIASIITEKTITASQMYGINVSSEENMIPPPYSKSSRYSDM